MKVEAKESTHTAIPMTPMLSSTAYQNTRLDETQISTNNAAEKNSE
jgi:hypothetical protein